MWGDIKVQMSTPSFQKLYLTQCNAASFAVTNGEKYSLFIHCEGPNSSS